MQKFVGCLILAGVASFAAGCKADQGSQTSSQLAEAPSDTRTLREATPVPQPPAVNAAPSDPRPLVVCFGDSLTAGFGADEGASYPDFLQKDLDRDGFHYRVVNEGESGDTTKDGLDRLSSVESRHPAVVVLEFGGNDGLRGLNPAVTRANLASMIEGLKGSGSKVVLAGITLPPDYGADYVNTFTSNYPTLAKRYSLPVLPFLLQNVYGVPGMMQADRTHATNKGNEIVARNVLPFVEPLLKH